MGVLEQLHRREEATAKAKWRARHALLIDMMKSYAAPLLVVGYVNPILSEAGGAVKLGAPNYAVIILGLAMAGGALIFVPAKE